MTELLRKLAWEGKLESALPALENAAAPYSGHTRSCIHREMLVHSVKFEGSPPPLLVLSPSHAWESHI